MRRAVPALLAMWAGVALGCVPYARAQDFTDPGICAHCHATQAALASDGGHAPLLDCAACHEDRRPGRIGRGHRSIPRSCTNHHATAVAPHPESKRTLKPIRLRRRCLTCHDVHGSSNANLMRSLVRFRGRLHAIDFHAAGGAVPGGFADPVNPGRGLCETCHATTKFYRADGQGEPHFPSDCTICHAHEASFRPVVDDASCTLCHTEQAAQLDKRSLHHDRFTGRCSVCHAEMTPEPGPGHRAVSACAECHSPERVPSHVPPGVAIPCASCHEPHGSDNIRLVRDVVRTPQGTQRAIRFTTLDGAVDGGFASASAPGAGLCEACHTQTQFYRGDGSGAPHYEIPCGQCHAHVSGFAPR
jgi:predicted CXXCH cytochrome family protein